MSLAARWHAKQSSRLIEQWRYPRLQRADRAFGRARAIILTCAALAIFGLDTFTDITSAIAVLYILILVAAGGTDSRLEISSLCAGCIGLTIASYLTTHDLTSDPAAALRVAFSILAILVTCTLLIRNIENRQRFEAQANLLDETADAIVLRELSGKVLFWNKGAERLYGVSRSMAVGRLHHDELDSRFPSPLAAIDVELNRNDAWNGEILQTRDDGSALIVSSRWTLQRNQTGAAWAVLETSRDITERRAADRALDESERRYRSIFNTLAVAVFEYEFTEVRSILEGVRGQGNRAGIGNKSEQAVFLAAVRAKIAVTNANPRALTLMLDAKGGQEFGRNGGFMPLNDDDLIACLSALDAGDALFEREIIVVSSEGHPRTLFITLHFPSRLDAVDRIQCSMIDLTEHKRLADDLTRMRSDLEHARRISSIGEVSATIAHEVNQPLAAIRANVGAAQRWLARGPAHHKEVMGVLDEVAAAAAHAGDIVKGVRRLFSRAEREDLPISIDEMIADAVRLVRLEVMDTRTEVALELGAFDAYVLGDRLLLQQALVNLATNAFQAMHDTSGMHTLRITSAVRQKMVIITARDNGPGFAPAIIEDALKAFASTRLGGMGLGLSICRSAIEAHGGHVRIANHEAGGALVELALPIAVADHDDGRSELR